MALSVSTSLATVSQNVASNSSVVRQTVKVSWTHGTYQASGASEKFSITSGSGATQSWGLTNGINTGRTQTGSQSFTHDFTVYHKSDGTQTVSATGSVTYWDGTKTASTSATLATIPRATTPGLPAGITLGDSLIIDLSSRASSSFTHTVQVNWYGVYTTIATKTSASTVNYTPPLDWAEQFPNQLTTHGTIIVDTYSGSTSVGRTQEAFNVTAPQSMAPTVTATFGNTNNVFGVFATNLSAVHAEVSAEGQYGTTVKSYSVSVDGTVYSGQDITSNLLSHTGSVPVTVTATDSRGLRGTYTENIQVVAYNKPSLASLSVRRCTADGTADDTGAYITLSGYGTISNIGNNAGTMYAKYRPVGTETWTAVDVTSTNDEGKVSASALFPADDTLSYEVYTAIADKATSAYSITAVSTGYATMDYYAGGRGVAFGTTATREGLGISMPLYGSGILDYVYPVGSVYMSFNSANPAGLFGGSWEQIEGVSLMAVGSTNQWQYLCGEGQTFTLDKTETVRYGITGKWIETTLEAGTYTANQTLFGDDPAYGSKKWVEKILVLNAGDTGGEVQHTMTTDELADHEHRINFEWATGTTGNANAVTKTSYKWVSNSTYLEIPVGEHAGRGVPMNNLPPYLAVYMWRRVS